MRKNRLFVGAFIASLLMAYNASAQLTVGSEIRPRAEIRAGYKDLLKPGNEPFGIATQRTRLNVGFKTEKIKTYISFQNAAVWGEQIRNKNRTATSYDSTQTNLFEGWADLSLNKVSGLRVGRQSLSIEDERLLSGANWGQAGAFLDGIMYHFDNDSVVKIRAFGSYNNQKDTTLATILSDKKFKTFDFLELKKEFCKNFNVTLLAILSGVQQPGTTDKYYLKNTFGGYFTVKNDEMALSCSGFYQNGESTNGKQARAYLINAMLKYTKNPYEVAIGFDILSGNDMENTDADYKKIDHKFDVLLGTTRPFQGTIELVNTKTSDAGLFNSYVKTKAQLTDALSLGVNYFFLSTQNNVGYTNSKKEYVSLNKYLGQEADALLSYKINADCSFEIGYAYLFAAEALKQVKKASTAYDNQNWMWMQLTFKPKLFEGALKN